MHGSATGRAFPDQISHQVRLPIQQGESVPGVLRQFAGNTVNLPWQTGFLVSRLLFLQKFSYIASSNKNRSAETAHMQARFDPIAYCLLMHHKQIRELRNRVGAVDLG